LVCVELVDLMERHPSQFMRFGGDCQWLAAICFQQKPDVVVNMGRLGAACRDFMRIHIEDLFTHRAKGLKSGFLVRLAESDAQDVGVAIGMTSRLQPFVELGVMGKQDTRTALIDDPRRPGNVADGQRSLKAVLLRFDKFGNALLHPRFVLVEGLMARQLREERLAGPWRACQHHLIFTLRW
jgi:hypothetical protein